MATTYVILEAIKLEGMLKELITKSNAENVSVTYNGSKTTLASALASIYASISALPTSANVDTKISTAISKLVNGAPEAYNTLKEIAAYLETHESAYTALLTTVGNKVDKVNGKTLSANDFTNTLKSKLESLPVITASDVSNWNAKAGTAVATKSANGLMSAADKARLDGIRGVRSGSEAPSDMLDGELFVRVVNRT